MQKPVLSLANARSLLVSIVLVNLMVAVTISIMFYNSYQQKQHEVATSTKNLAYMLDESITSLIEKTDLVLQSSVDEIERQLAAGHADATKITTYLNAQKLRVAGLDNVRAMDEKGILLYGSEIPTNPYISLATRDYYLACRDNPQAGLVIGQPVISKVSGKWILPFARRINKPDGSFGGAVYSTIQLQKLETLFSKIDVGNKGTIALRNTSMAIIARYPPLLVKESKVFVGDSNISRPFHDTLLTSPLQGTYISGATSIDSTSRTHSYHKFDLLPFYINVGLAEDEYLENWRKSLRTSLILLGIFMLVSAAFTVATIRSMRRQAADATALQKSETTYSALFNNLTNGFALHEVVRNAAGKVIDYRYLEVNPAFEKMTGFSRGQLIGKRVKEVMPQTEDYWIEHYGEVATSGVPKTFENYSSELDRWYSTYAYRPAPEQFAVLAQDITGHVEAMQSLKASEERWAFAIEGSGDGVWDWDIAAGKMLVSAQWKKMMGFSENEVTDSLDEWRNRVHPDDMPQMMASLQAHLAHIAPTYINEHRVLCRDGNYKWILARGKVMSRDADGTPLRMIGIHTDITERRLAAEAMNTAKEEAENLAQAKTEFLANMSHEIRTPMNGIIGLTQLALNQPASPEMRDYLGKISSSAQSLLGILNDILDLSKVEAGRMSIEAAPYDLDGLIDTVRGLFEARARSQGLNFKIQVDTNVPRDLIGDALRLQQILSNLLGNAIKFTRQGSVSIKVELKQQEGSQAMIGFSITDTGIGIAPDDLEKLFQPFSQVDGSITRRFGGTGLGLAISNNLVRLMASKIHVSSKPGKGSTFSFDLLQGIPSHTGVRMTRNRQPSREDTLAELARRSSRFAGVRILVAEDNLINQQVVSEFLKLSGMQVKIANNGQEALDWLGKSSFDAVLMDAHMPVMGGVEATQKIRAREEFATLPIIALTAGVTVEERENCLSSGMNDFIAKPVNPEALVKALEKWVQPPGPGIAPSPAAMPEPGSLSLPGFHLDNLLRMLGGSTQLAVELLHSFAEDMAAMPTDIEAAVIAGEYETARALAHKIKGAAGNVGATELHAAAAQLEADFRDSRFDNAALLQFQQAFRQTVATIKGLQAPSDALEATDEDMDALRAGAMALDRLLAEDEFISEDILAALEKHLSSTQREAFKQLRQRIHEIRYDEARMLLRKLADLPEA